MSVSQALSSRIAMVCALIILFFSLMGGILFVLPLIEKLTLGPNTSWISYFIMRQTIWRLPVEFYIAIIALILLVVRRSTNWSMVWSTALFAINFGMVFRNLYNISSWIMIVSSIIALYAASASFEGSLKNFLRELFHDVKQLSRRQTTIWKIVASILTVTFVLNYMHNEIIRQTSEARDYRFVEWYKNERSKAGATNGIELKIFTDYQCLACSLLVPRYLETVLTAGNNAVQIRLHDYPLDTACNVLSVSSPHPAACSAAYAARLVDKEILSESHNFRSWLYVNRSDLNNDVILQRLKELGIDNPQDMFGDEIQQAVRDDLLEAMVYGIGSVPSVVLNNVLLPSGLPPSKLELLLKSEIVNNTAVNEN
jgi:predicted DsbA family dithiol-disulfide isomerase